MNIKQAITNINDCQAMLEVFYKRFSDGSVERKCVENMMISLQGAIDEISLKD